MNQSPPPPYKISAWGCKSVNKMWVPKNVKMYFGLGYT